MLVASSDDNYKKMDWRIALGLATSVGWLLLIALYLFQQLNWQQFLQLPLDEIGSFLGGAFSPLAFLWLVIGFFIQQGEINENTRNIEIQAQHTNLDNFLKMAEIIYRHLGVISGYLCMSCSEELNAVAVEPIDFEDKWSRSSNGDTGIFSRALITYRFDDQGVERDMHHIFYGTAIRLRHSASYRRVFEELLENARLCDATGSLHNALVDGTVWGILYKTLLAVEEKEAAPTQ